MRKEKIKQRLSVIQSLFIGSTIVIGALSGFLFAHVANAQTSEEATKLVDYSKKQQRLADSIEAVKEPKLTDPSWAEEPANSGGDSSSHAAHTVTYDVMTRGTITANFAEFKSLANATLNDSRGWSRLNVSFKEVANGGRFTLVLSQASKMPTFSSGCSSDYSCRAGRYVVINQDRWLYATSSWNAAHGSLRDYRHMVVNHETGHWLGHEHAFCGGAGRRAPVMQQQSIGLQGCSFNPWPLSNELWSTQLGIQL